MAHPIVHIEIPAPDLERSAAFYRTAFAWRVDLEEGGGYATFQPPEGTSSVGGGLDPSREVLGGHGGIALYIQCDDIPQKLADIEAAGGGTVRPKTESASLAGSRRRYWGEHPMGEREEDREIEELVQRFRPRARRITGFHGIPGQDADDLLQQTYLTFLSKRDEIRNPEAWLAGTLSQRCLMFWRSRRRSWLAMVEDGFLEARPKG